MGQNPGPDLWLGLESTGSCCFLEGPFPSLFGRIQLFAALGLCRLDTHAEISAVSWALLESRGHPHSTVWCSLAPGWKPATLGLAPVTVQILPASSVVIVSCLPLPLWGPWWLDWAHLVSPSSPPYIKPDNLNSTCRSPFAILCNIVT